ncbi:hypothetical protein [Streptomyces syringium]|uniref:hypothetical protein n=1 Tax=Streptomyces syringium TaxID=76729 RepID=UPI0033A1761E
MTQTESLHSQGPALWVRVTDGAWAKDGNWVGYYEIWQKDRETGRPLIVQDDFLRFVDGATPGKFNLQDST